MSLDTVFVKMHTADPGAGGTAAAAVNATRKQLSCSEFMDVQGRLPQDAVIAYTGGEVTTTESYAWVSYWTAVTGGTWLGNEDIPNQAATTGVALNIAAGTILVSDPKVLDYMIRTEISTVVPDGTNTFWKRLRTWRGLHANVLRRLQRVKFAKQSAQQI